MIDRERLLISKNYDTCICLALNFDELSDLCRSDAADTLRLNGVEVSVLIENITEREDILSTFLCNNPLFNWRLIFYEKNKLGNALAQAIELSKKSYFFFSIEKKIDLNEFQNLKYLHGYYTTIVSKRDKKGRILSLYCQAENLSLRLAPGSTFQLGLEGIIINFGAINIRELKYKGAAKNFDAYPGKGLREMLFGPVAENVTPMGEICYDYLKKPFEKFLFSCPLKKFSESDLIESLPVSGRLKIIALVQTYNESQNIQHLLVHLEKYCDGIILLDDGSSDGTYELAEHNKLLLKVKKSRTVFNDLENRNMLLDLVSLFNYDWAFFIDADERFDNRFGDIYELANNRIIDVVAFNLINLWDSDLAYRTDIADSNQFSRNGILVRWRMFRNIGRCQIISSSSLHFPTVPYFKNVARSPLLLRHYGMLEKEQRTKKYNFYLSQDGEFENHSNRNYAMLDEEQRFETEPVESITLDQLR